MTFKMGYLFCGKALCQLEVRNVLSRIFVCCLCFLRLLSVWLVCLAVCSVSVVPFFIFFFFSFIFISWGLITLQYCSGFCHTLILISQGFTCIPHPDPPSHLPLYPIPLGLPSAPGLSTCLMHPTWTGDLFHPR